MKICIITHHEFWAEPLGCGTLMRARYDLLKSYFGEVSILYISTSTGQCPLPGLTVNVKDTITSQQVEEILRYIKTNKTELCYFSYNQFHALVDYIDCKCIVEVHDVMHLREEQFRTFNYKPPYQADKEEELNSLKKYDGVLAINLDEVAYLKKNGVVKSTYLPPSIQFSTLEKPNNINHFGLIGSNSKPNLDGLMLLSEKIKTSKNLIAAGPISVSDIGKTQFGKEVKLMGLLNDLTYFYQSVGLALSPVRFGAGLKIKVFEALSFNTPVLATLHSIEGFPPGIADVVTVVDQIEHWDEDLILEAKNKNCFQIRDYFIENFSVEKCYGILKNIL